MNLYLKILIKLLCVAALIVLINIIYKNIFWEKDIEKYADAYSGLKNIEDSCEIIYFGESSNKAFFVADIDNSNISTFTSRYFPKVGFGNVTKEASHAGVYKKLIEAISSKKVKTIVVTMNLRSFDATWIYSKLETPLMKSLVMAKNNPAVINRLLLSLKMYDNISENEGDVLMKKAWKENVLTFPYDFKYKNVVDWDRGMAEGGWTSEGGKWDMSKIELSCHYIKTYAFLIDTLNNPRIKDFDDIVKTAKKRGYQLIFNLLAENVEKANELVGDPLIYLMKHNRDLLVKRYQKNGVLVVDNLEIVPSNQYIDSTWTTEHYKQTGRQAIARNIALALKKFYPAQFVDVNQKSAFINDFEDSLKCNNSKSLSRKYASSGKLSSCINNKTPFTPSFEKYFFEIPTEKNNYLNLNCMAYMSSELKNAQVVITLENNNKLVLWKGFPLYKFVSGYNRWEKISIQFKFPDSMKPFDKLKIYGWNDSEQSAYIDDLEIKFSKTPGNAK